VENLATKVGIPTTEKVASTATEQIGKKALGETLKDIGKKTAIRAGVGAGTGYAYDVSNNLQQNKEGADIFKPGMGTALGGAIPLGIGAIQAGAAITADTAPRIINSLVKPSKANFAYGKNPGRTVSEMGITGNNFEDFGTNVQKAKQEVGSQIGSIISSPENANLTINANEDVQKIDQAMATAAKGGKNNQGIVTALSNIKDSLLYGHQVTGDGTIVRTSETPLDLSALSPQEAFDLKQKVAAATKFTGNPSDDKTINSVLKDVYGGLKEQINSTVGVNNPEITDLNQKYADLTSADLAIKNRAAIAQRADMISMPIKFGTGAGIITAIGTGGAAIPAIIAGATAGALEKALASTAVKTRVAAWLGSETPGTISKVLAQNPEVKTVLYRLLPKFASKIGR
jgi:hypothetical protein